MISQNPSVGKACHLFALAQEDEVLPLDDSRWGELTTAYGSGLEVPGLLRRLSSEGVPAVPKSYWDGCPWTMLWATICHQGTVYTASYAAVPHLVRLASQAAPDARARLIDLITYIEMGRAWRSAPPVPAFLEAGYLAALEELREILAASMRERWETRSACRLAAAFMVLNGETEVARYLSEVAESYPACPSCGEALFGRSAGRGSCQRAEPLNGLESQELP